MNKRHKDEDLSMDIRRKHQMKDLENDPTEWKISEKKKKSQVPREMSQNQIT